MSPRLVAIVMHGSGRYYLEPLLARGRLPNLQRLVHDGHSRYFHSELPLAAGAWVTILTGLSVGEHGVIDYVDLDARSYDGLAGRYADAGSYHAYTIQTVLSDAGLRVASVFLPMTSPPWPVNGMIISGFPLPDETRPPTYPPDLAARLPRFSDRKLLLLRYDAPDAIDSYLRSNLDWVERLTRDACRSGTFDVVLGCVPTPDLAHHYFWRRDDPEAMERIYHYYDLVDATLGRIVGDLDARTTVVVCSDHGGRAAPGRIFGVNRWLLGEGLLVRRNTALAGKGPAGVTDCVVRWAKTHRLNHALAPYLRGALRRRVSAITHQTAFVDWSRSRAYGLDLTCPLVGVEVNLRGRQARGIVAQESYADVRRELVARLSGVVDPETGTRVFTRVCLREELFHGAHVGRLPDVVGILADDYDAKPQLDLPVTGPNVGQYDYPYLGYHGRDAFFAACGPGIPSGTTTDVMRPMLDLAPTLLSLVGVPVPDSMKGRPFEF